MGAESGALLVPHDITAAPASAERMRSANIRFGLIISEVAASTTPERLLSSSRELHIHHALVFFLLDLLMSGHSIRVGGKLSEMGRPLVGGSHELPVVDNAIGVDGHHGHLPSNFQVRQHFADGLGGDEVGVTLLFNVVFDLPGGFVVGNDVEINFTEFTGNWVQRL